MNYKYLFLILFLSILIGCKKKQYSLSKIEGKKIEINDSLKENNEIEAFIKPYREHIEKDLDSVLAYAVDTYHKDDGELNTPIGNLMVDIMYEQGNPIFNKRTGKNIDIVLSNHGGIRSSINKGSVTARTAYEVMPFENEILVISLKGNKVREMVDYLVKRREAHPFFGLQVILSKDYELLESTIDGKKINDTIIYYVATNDWIYNMADFLKPNEGIESLNYKVRNAMIDYFKKVDTINPVRNNSFIRLQ